ncbi:MAG: hypothetical protein V4683_19550 [Bacteroidota bacterium]
MKNNIKGFLLYFLLINTFLLESCTQKNPVLVSEKYIDSLLTIKGLSARELALKTDLNFWKIRYEKDTNSYANSPQYAGMLLAKFRQEGNINNLILGEKIIARLNENQKGAESGFYRTLANYSSLQHRFQEANNFANRALQIGDNQYESLLILFDASFELNKIDQARIILAKIKKKYEYAYYFRLSKMQHYDGKIEEATESMQKAASLSNGNIYLEQIAISNLADLQLHVGDYANASINFQKSLALDHADYHSLKGLGLIAQHHDKNAKIAAKIFNFIATKTQSPDIYFNLSQLAQSTGNQKEEKKYAQIFSEKANQPIYGNMYNKYLIELYDGILNDRLKMLQVAQREMLNRNSPQTNTWYAWALYKNNQKAKALDIYNNSIAGKPLEGLEHYFLGKMMENEKKNYNAKSYFEAAYKSKFELAPAKRLELESKING